jgi:CO dehydrogenase/acetyl-CoA synthase epsilon subunit
MTMFSKAKGMQELINGQAELSREFSERNMEILRKGMTVANESGSEYSNLVQEGVKSAQERIAEVTKATLKAA